MYRPGFSERAMRGSGVPRAGAADALHSIRCRGDLRFQHRAHPYPGKVRIADNTGGNPCLPIHSRRGHRRDTVGEFDLADIFHLIRSIRTKHRQVFDKHGGDNIMAGIEIAFDFIHHVTSRHLAVAIIPQVMMRVTDWQVRFKRRPRWPAPASHGSTVQSSPLPLHCLVHSAMMLPASPAVSSDHSASASAVTS